MRPRCLSIGDQRLLGLIIAPLWLTGCSSRTEVDVLQWWLHNSAGEPVLTMIAAEVCVTDHDRGPSTSFEAIALRSFRGAGLTPSPSAIELPPRHGSPFETPIVVPFMRATADTVNAEGGARGPLVLFSPDERFDSVVLKPLLWDHSLGSAPPPKDIADIVSSVSGAIARTQPRQIGGTGTTGEILVGWAPDVGQRFTFAFPPPLDPPTSCPEGYTDLSVGASGRMNMSPSGRFLAYTSRGGAACNHQESTASKGLMAWFDAVVIDAATGAPVAPPLHIEAAHLRFSLQPRAAVADDGVMIVLLHRAPRRDAAAPGDPLPRPSRSRRELRGRLNRGAGRRPIPVCCIRALRERRGRAPRDVRRAVTRAGPHPLQIGGYSAREAGCAFRDPPSS